MVLEKMLVANIVVWSFLLYYFGVPGILKNQIDRQLPTLLPFMSERSDGYGKGNHDTRYDMTGIKHILISTCGFYSTEGNYDGVLAMFDHSKNCTTIFCAQGELFSIKELSSRTNEYLGYIKGVGVEYAKGEISKETNKKLQILLYPKAVF